MLPSGFEYHRPDSLEEAMHLLAEHGDEAKVLAGGQSLIPVMKLGVRNIDMPLTSGKVWEAIQAAQSGQGWGRCGLAAASPAEVPTHEAIDPVCGMTVDVASAFTDRPSRTRRTTSAPRAA